MPVTLSFSLSLSFPLLFWIVKFRKAAWELFDLPVGVTLWSVFLNLLVS